MPSPPCGLRPRRRRGGFALLVTIVLVAFLVLILVSLAAFTRVETQVATNNTHLTQARQGALFGLQIALGELQRHAGPDQRVTAPATTVYPVKDVTNATGELFDLYRARAQTAAKDTYLTPAERAQWEADLRAWWSPAATGNRNPHWTAVLDSSLRRDSATLGKYGEFKRGQLPVWLVSGNERPEMRFDPATAASYPSGYHTPDTRLDENDENVVKLVGHGSAAPAADSVDGLDGAVRVVRQPLTGTPPGASDPQTIGHYAYWVGDESTKANFAIRDPWFTNNTPSSPQYRNRLQVPQRIGWERIEGLRQVFDGSDDAPSVNDERFLKVLAREQIAFLHPDFTDPLRQAFHHLTAYSRSLQTDTALGGLKKDLTVFLEGSGSGVSASAPILDRSLYDNDDPRFGANNTGFPRPAGATNNLPTWGQLKNWSDTKAISESSSVSVIPGRAPVIANFDVFFGFSRDGDTLRMHWMPAIVLWNPYDTKLDSTPYRLKYRHNTCFVNFRVATEGLADLTPGSSDDDNRDGQMHPAYPSWFIHRLDGVDWYDRNAGSLFKGHVGGAGGGYSFGLPNIPYTTDPFGRYRWRPFDRGDNAKIATWEPNVTWVTYEFTSDFEPGQVKVFTVGNEQEVLASRLHAGTDTVALQNVFDLDFPASYSFPVATLTNAAGITNPATQKTRALIVDLPGQTTDNPSVKLINADTGAELWTHERLAAIGNSKHFTPKHQDGNPSSWRLVPTTEQWRSDPKNGGWNDKDTPVIALHGFTRVAPFAVNELYSTANGMVSPHGRQRAFATFNLAAPTLDLSTKVEQSRSVWRSNNTDKFYSNQLVLLNNPLQAGLPDIQSAWGSGWANGATAEGYTLMTHLNVDKLGNKGLSRLPMRQVRRANALLLSLGQFQQANLSRSWQPSFPIGNSEATPYVDRARVAGIESYDIGVATGVGYFPANPASYPGRYRTSTSSVPNDAANEMIDLSYLLNEGLWDRHFLSSIPQTGAVSLDNTTPLPNSRHRFTGGAASLSASDVRDFDTAAAWLENVGALNVNSTSVEAWKSLLTAFRGLGYASDDRTGDDVSKAIPVSRTLDPLPAALGGGNLKFTFDGRTLAHIGASPTGSRDYSKFFLGFRHLTDDMIQALAERIVDEVRLRGPFHSVADFVNRRLVAPDGAYTSGSPWKSARDSNLIDASNNNQYTQRFGMTDGYNALAGLSGLNGALQRAINLSGINGGMNYPGTAPLADRAFRVQMDLSANSIAGGLPGGALGTTANRPMQMFPDVAHYLDAENQAGAPVGEAGQLLSHSSGFVTSADILSMIGPALAARGDTFLVRTYGDAVNPATGETAARAWLEAVVQRTIEPVTPAGATGAARFQPGDDFGRRFEIVSIRWLGPDDI